MTGPKILNQPTYDRAPARRPDRATGIRRTSDGKWAALRNGRLIAATGSRLLAIRLAGSDQEV
jgi:hypothetical protein